MVNKAKDEGSEEYRPQVEEGQGQPIYPSKAHAEGGVRVSSGRAGAVGDPSELLAQWHAADDQDFQRRVRMAVLRTAQAILTEDPASVPDHAARLALAARAVQTTAGLDEFVRVGAPFLASMGLSSASTDDELLGAISPMVSALASLPLPA